MSNDQSGQKSKDNSPRRREGIGRRDLWLSGTSLVAAAAVSGTALPGSAEAQEVLPFPPMPSGSTANRTMNSDQPLATSPNVSCDDWDYPWRNNGLVSFRRGGVAPLDQLLDARAAVVCRD